MPRLLTDEVLRHVTISPMCELCGCEDLTYLGSYWYTPKDQPKTYAKYMSCPECGHFAKYNDEPDSPRTLA